MFYTIIVYFINQKGKGQPYYERILILCKALPKGAILAIFCIEAETVFELIIPLVMADIIDVGVAAGDQHYIVMKGLQMIGMASSP